MSKRVVPREIHVLDLFCGNGQRLFQLGRRHPRKVFVGVDHDGHFLPSPPPNVFLIRQDVLEFLNSRKKAGSVKQVNVDFGLHFLSPRELPLFYRHIAQVMHPKGRLFVSTYLSDSFEGGLADRLVSEANRAGLRLTMRRPLINKPGASTSSYSDTHGRLIISGNRSVDAELAEAGAAGVGSALRLTFRKHK